MSRKELRGHREQTLVEEEKVSEIGADVMNISEVFQINMTIVLKKTWTVNE